MSVLSLIHHGLATLRVRLSALIVPGLWSGWFVPRREPVPVVVRPNWEHPPKKVRR